MITFPYSSLYDPAIPVCEITLMGANQEERVTLPGIIDTGADATLVPIIHLQAIGARRVFEAGLRSQWGERRSVFLYLVDIGIADIVLHGMYIVGDDIGEELVIGRDVLNRLCLTLDGPALQMRLLV